MPAIDHLVFVSPDLDAGIERVATLTGVTAVPGGSHPGRGTHNALAAFDDETYLEIIAIDPAQADHDGPRPFGLAEDVPMHLATFAIHPTGTETIDAVAKLLRDAGHDPGPVVPMRRTRPDGVELHWHLTMPVAATRNGVIPFVIDWGETPNPAASLPRLGALHTLRASHLHGEVRELLESLDPRITGEVGPTGLAADIETESGVVTLR